MIFGNIPCTFNAVYRASEYVAILGFRISRTRCTTMEGGNNRAGSGLGTSATCLAAATKLTPGTDDAINRARPAVAFLRFKRSTAYFAAEFRKREAARTRARSEATGKRAFTPGTPSTLHAINRTGMVFASAVVKVVGTINATMSRLN